VTYPTTLRLTADGVAIVVQRPTAQAVATAARAAVGCMSIGDGRALFNFSHDDDPESTPQVVILAWWIAGELGLSDDVVKAAREMVGRSGVARG
jgi:hypothetical protein